MRSSWNKNKDAGWLEQRCGVAGAKMWDGWNKKKDAGWLEQRSGVAGDTSHPSDYLSVKIVSYLAKQWKCSQTISHG